MYFLKTISFSSSSSLLLVLAFTNAAVINALPTANTRARTVTLDRRDVWSPHIFEPNETTVWTANTPADVVWNATRPSAQITNPTGTILLGHIDPSNPSSGLNLDIQHPLASKVDLSLGKTTIQVPANVTAGQYIIVLMGDSGNQSPQFKIQAAVTSPAGASSVGESSTTLGSSNPDAGAGFSSSAAPAAGVGSSPTSAAPAAGVGSSPASAAPTAGAGSSPMSAAPAAGLGSSPTSAAGTATPTAPSGATITPQASDSASTDSSSPSNAPAGVMAFSLPSTSSSTTASDATATGDSDGLDASS